MPSVHLRTCAELMRYGDTSRLDNKAITARHVHANAQKILAVDRKGDSHRILGLKLRRLLDNN